MKFGAGSTEKAVDPAADSPERAISTATDVPLENIQKGRWERSWPTIACGAGLFSDGYLNGYGYGRLTSHADTVS